MCTPVLCVVVVALFYYYASTRQFSSFGMVIAFWFINKIFRKKKEKNNTQVFKPETNNTVIPLATDVYFFILLQIYFKKRTAVPCHFLRV